MRALYRVRACVRYARQVIRMLNSVVLFATAQYLRLATKIRAIRRILILVLALSN
jgi:hypothetical protein